LQGKAELTNTQSTLSDCVQQKV